MKAQEAKSRICRRVALCTLVAAMMPDGRARGQAPEETPETQNLTVVDLLSDDELAALAAPIALYPDVLLAQILTAATYPIDIVQAARWLRGNPDMATLMDQPWDPSVLSLCNYPDLIYLLDEDLDWTNALGAAFVHQQEALMNAVQELRRTAQSSGVLQTTPQQTVVVEESVIRVVPSDPQVIYVPQYDPQVIYVYDDYDRYYAGAFTGSVIGFGAGFALGAWLDLDCDWYRRSIVSCRPGYWGGYRHWGVVAWGDHWHSKVGVRRCFKGGHSRGYWAWNHGGRWDRDGHGHGGAWRRGGSSPGPSFSGRFRSGDSRRQFADNVRGGDRSRFRRNASGGDRTDFRPSTVAGERTEFRRRTGGRDGTATVDRSRSSDRTPTANRTGMWNRTPRATQTEGVRRTTPDNRRNFGDGNLSTRSSGDSVRRRAPSTSGESRPGTSRGSGMTFGRSTQQLGSFRSAERGRARPSYDGAIRRSTGSVDRPRSSAGPSLRRGASGGTLDRPRSGGFPTVGREANRAPSRSAFRSGGSGHSSMRSATRAPSSNRSSIRSGGRGGSGRSSGMRGGGGRGGGGRRR